MRENADCKVFSLIQILIMTYFTQTTFYDKIFLIKYFQAESDSMSDYYFEKTRREFMSNRRIDYGYSHTFHYHNGCEIFLVNKGSTTFNFETASFELKHGTMVVIPAYVPHFSICMTNDFYDRYIISMQPEYIKTLSTKNTNLLECFKQREDCSNYISVLNDDQMAQFMNLAHKLDDLSQTELFGSDALRRAYITELLVLVNRAVQYNGSIETKAMPELVYNVLSYIVRHWKENFSLGQLSAELHMSGAYISRKFKENMGISLREYIVNKKVSHACILLRMGENVSSACFASGFNDYANFIRTFKKVMGVTPGEYAKNNKEKYKEETS